MFEVIFLIFISLYFIQIAVFLIGAVKEYPKLEDDELPNATVIVAARNEHDNIIDCLTSLNNLEYPEDKLEIIVVDDHSTDDTYQLAENYIKDKPRFKLIQPEKSIGIVKGKANAIANAIEIAAGDIILTTDADCVVSKTWAKTLASYFTKDTAMVCGYTNQFDNNLYRAMQSVDFVYLLGVAGGTMNLGKPLSCIGNNMSYRKDVYHEIGGYEKIPFSVTEDFQVLMAMHNLKKYKIIYPLDKEGLVTSKPFDDLKSLYWQKKRWGVGGLKSDLVGFSVMATAFITHVLILTQPLFFTVNTLVMSLFKFFIDYYFLKEIYRKLSLKLKISHFIIFEIYFLIYVVLLPFVIPNRKVRWKGRTYN
jgi:cellulose synthase/poly-beta-1,6-N-acetylglucosamine synthase-like glycosyltransferase